MENAIDRLLRREEVEHIVGLRHSAIYRKIGTGEFPRPLRVGRRAVRWRQSDIDGWLAGLSPT